LIEENIAHGDRGFFFWLHRRLGAPLALAGTKAAINAGLKVIADQVMDVGLLHEQVTFASEDVIEGANAFSERRKPHFKGKKLAGLGRLQV
jgi:enoyl-CoA hydratase/carnithine racemase